MLRGEKYDGLSQKTETRIRNCSLKTDRIQSVSILERLGRILEIIRSIQIPRMSQVILMG